MRYIKGFLMAWGCFCRIPCPYRGWEEDNRYAMLNMFPLIGTALGVLVGVIWWLLSLLGVSSLLTGALLTFSYFWMTGFIHLDGFMDCCDAVLSRREQARRREILKDSHVGSFAVICLVLLAMAGYSVWSCPARPEKLWALPLVCAGVRCVSAGAVLGLKPLDTSGYRDLVRSGGAVAAACVLAAVSVGLGMLLSGRGFLPPAAAVMAAAVTVFSLRRNLGGMCGDISGAAITLGELAGSAAVLLL